MSFPKDFRAVIDHRQTLRGVWRHVSHLRRFKNRSGFVLNFTISGRLPGVIPALSDSSASVVALRSRLGSSDRLTLDTRDVCLGTFNCRTLLSEVRQQELVRFMESRQIDLAI